MVHGDHVVEATEIRRRQLARAQPAEVVAAPAGSGHRAAIRRLADVIVGGTGGIDVEFQTGMFTRGDRAQHTLGGR